MATASRTHQLLRRDPRVAYGLNNELQERKCKTIDKLCTFFLTVKAAPERVLYLPTIETFLSSLFKRLVSFQHASPKGSNSR